MLKLLGLFILVGGLWYGIGAAMTQDSKGAIIGVFIGIIGLLITWKAEGKNKKEHLSSFPLPRGLKEPSSPLLSPSTTRVNVTQVSTNKKLKIALLIFLVVLVAIVGTVVWAEFVTGGARKQTQKLDKNTPTAIDSTAERLLKQGQSGEKEAASVPEPDRTEQQAKEEPGQTQSEATDENENVPIIVRYLNFKFEDLFIGMTKTIFLNNHTDAIAIPQKDTNKKIGIFQYMEKYRSASALVSFLDDKVYSIAIIYAADNIADGVGMQTLYARLVPKIGPPTEQRTPNPVGEDDISQEVKWELLKREFILTKYNKEGTITLVIRDTDKFDTIATRKESTKDVGF
jgi:hypothetical protein